MDDPKLESRFEDRGEIGRGGMSVVLKGYDPVLQRNTALKVLTPGRDVDRARTRFLDEARITGQLEHPNIVPIYEFGTDRASHDFITMKLVQGQNLLDRIRTLGEARLDPENLAESLQILLKVCDAVAFAHSRGIVHRDLKPSNIMVGEFGEVYVMDWGIALRLGDPRPEPVSFDERGVLGTPTFVAPEQIEDPDGVDGRADVYCIGGLLYALLTARAPHQGRTPILRLMASSHGRIVSPEETVKDPRLPAALSRIAMRALRLRPEERYQTVGSFKADITAFLHGAWHLPSRVFPPGAEIVREGEIGDEAFVIRSGRCRVHSAASGTLRELGPGEVFGELAILIPGGRRTSSVEATGEVEVQVVTREVLTRGLGMHSWMGVFVQAMAERFAELEARLAKS